MQLMIMRQLPHWPSCLVILADAAAAFCQIISETRMVLSVAVVPSRTTRPDDENISVPYLVRQRPPGGGRRPVQGFCPGPPAHPPWDAPARMMPNLSSEGLRLSVLCTAGSAVFAAGSWHPSR